MTQSPHEGATVPVYGGFGAPKGLVAQIIVGAQGQSEIEFERGLVEPGEQNLRLIEDGPVQAVLAAFQPHGQRESSLGRGAAQDLEVFLEGPRRTHQKCGGGEKVLRPSLDIEGLAL